MGSCLCENGSTCCEGLAKVTGAAVGATCAALPGLLETATDGWLGAAPCSHGIKIRKETHLLAGVVHQRPDLRTAQHPQHTSDRPPTGRASQAGWWGASVIQHK